MNLSKFVQDATTNIDHFERGNMEQLKDLIKLAIDYFQLKSTEKKDQGTEYLYLASMAEENILSKVLELASGEELQLEAVYNGQVIRKH